MVFIVALWGCSSGSLGPEPGAEDYVEPELTVNTGGSFLGDTATVEGQARGLTGVTVNGVEAYRNGDAYQVTVPLERGTNTVEVQGIDGRDDPWIVRRGVLSGSYADPDATMEEALTVRLNEPGLVRAMDLATDYLLAQDIPGMVMGFNPVYEGSYDVLGYEAGSLSVDVAGIDFARPMLVADPRPGYVAISLSIPYFELDLATSGEAIGIAFDEVVALGADYVDVQLVAVLDAQDGVLRVDTSDAQVQLVGFWFDVDVIPDVVEDFVADTARAFLEERLAQTLDTALPPLLEERLAGLEIAVETEILGRNVGVEVDLAGVVVDDAGIELHTGMRVAVERRVLLGAPGYLASPSRPATLSTTHDAAFAVSDNLLNNVLFQAWRSNLLALDLDSARGEIDPALFEPLGARENVRVMVEAELPPILVEEDGQAVVEITELLVRIETPGGEKGEYLDLAISASVGIDLVVEGGVLKLSLHQPDIFVDVRGSDWGLADNTLTRLLAEQLPVDALMLLLGHIEVPLPSVAGLTVVTADVLRDGSGVQTTIGASL